MNKQEILDILSDDKNNEKLFKLADEARYKYVGNEVHLRGLIEFSNICKKQCKYCGLQAGNHLVERYRILKNDILISAKRAVELGYRTLVLQSGEDDYYDSDKMCEIIREIKNLDVALTLSIGEKTYDEYKAYKKAGADRFLLRIETTDEKLYAKMHPHADYNNRVRCLLDLKTLGYEVGTGCLVGLPEQTLESLSNDIMFFKDIDADMIGIGPFIPHEHTPLKNASHGDFILALKIMALTRLTMLDINIPATTAMETLNPNGRIIALQSGANVVMPNVTPIEYRAKYEIYPGKICVNESADKCRNCIEQKILSIGRIISKGYGFRGSTK